MNLFKFLKQRLTIFPNIKTGELKNDVVPIDSVQRCAETNMTNSGSPGSGHGVPDQLMYPSLFRNKRKRVKK